jgi:hypothetical protein
MSTDGRDYHWAQALANAIIYLEMPENSRARAPKKRRGQDMDGKVEISPAATATSSAEVRVRLIQHSPAADPKLVEEALEFARELKQEIVHNKDAVNLSPEAPLILPVQK